MRIHRGRMTFLMVALGVGLITAYFGQPYVQDITQMIWVIIIFCIITGCLLNFIYNCLHGKNLLSGSWRILHAQWRKSILPRLHRLGALVIFYTLAVLSLFVTTLFKDALLQSSFIWCERLCLGMVATGIVLILGLPFELIAIQQEQIDILIENRKSVACVEDDDHFVHQ